MTKHLDFDENNRVKTTQVLLHYWKPITAVAIAGLIGCAGYWGYAAKVRSENQKVRAELYRFEKVIQDKEKELYDAAVKKVEDKKDAKSKKAASMDLPEVSKDAKTFADNYQKSADDLEQAILKHSGVDAAGAAAINLADFYVEYGQAEKAKNLLRKVLEQKPSSSVLAGLVKSQLGGLLMTKDTCKEAIDLFNGILADKTLVFLEAPVLARRAACYIELGDMNSAEADITKVKTEYSESEAAKQVDTFKIVGLARGTESK